LYSDKVSHFSSISQPQHYVSSTSIDLKHILFKETVQ